MNDEHRLQVMQVPHLVRQLMKSGWTCPYSRRSCFRHVLWPAGDGIRLPWWSPSRKITVGLGRTSIYMRLGAAILSEAHTRNDARALLSRAFFKERLVVERFQASKAAR